MEFEDALQLFILLMLLAVITIQGILPAIQTAVSGSGATGATLSLILLLPLLLAVLLIFIFLQYFKQG